LDQLLQEQRKNYRFASITSGFYDSRGVSRYRSQPGLHAGYDIAMPAGTAVRAAWPGKVTAVIPWAEGEWGVQVVHSDGTSATYGHLAPLSFPGQNLGTGDLVGTVARDHVDVKMRDCQGVLFDFGELGAWKTMVAPEPVLPSARALDFQRRWRLCSDTLPTGPSRGQWKTLMDSGLVAGNASAPGQDSFEDLRRLWRKFPVRERRKLTWNEKDRERKEGCLQLVQRLKERYDLGLVSKNSYTRSREKVRLWEEILP